MLDISLTNQERAMFYRDSLRLANFPHQWQRLPPTTRQSRTPYLRTFNLRTGACVRMRWIEIQFVSLSSIGDENEVSFDYLSWCPCLHSQDSQSNMKLSAAVTALCVASATAFAPSATIPQVSAMIEFRSFSVSMAC